MNKGMVQQLRNNVDGLRNIVSVLRNSVGCEEVVAKYDEFLALLQEKSK